MGHMPVDYELCILLGVIKIVAATPGLDFVSIEDPPKFTKYSNVGHLFTKIVVLVNTYNYVAVFWDNLN